MSEELPFHRNTPESKLWTALANDPDVVVTQLKPTARSGVGRVSRASYIPNLAIHEFTTEAGIQMPMDGVLPVMALHSLGRTMLIGDRNIMQYGKVQSLTPGLSVWELPKAANPTPQLIESVHVCETRAVCNHKPGDNKNLARHLLVSSVTEYKYAAGLIENVSQYPVFIAAIDDPGAGDILGGMRIYGPARE